MWRRSTMTRELGLCMLFLVRLRRQENLLILSPFPGWDSEPSEKEKQAEHRHHSSLTECNGTSATVDCEPTQTVFPLGCFHWDIFIVTTGKEANIENWCWEVGQCSVKSKPVFFWPSEMFVSGLWKSLILKATKSPARWKQSFMGHSGGWKTKMQRKRWRQGWWRFWSTTKDPPTGFGLKVICVNILAKNMTSFCLYPDNLNKTKFKDNGLICLTERSSNRRALGWYCQKLLLLAWQNILYRFVLFQTRFLYIALAILEFTL